MDEGITKVEAGNLGLCVLLKHTGDVSTFDGNELDLVAHMCHTINTEDSALVHQQP